MSCTFGHGLPVHFSLFWLLEVESGGCYYIVLRIRVVILELFHINRMLRFQAIINQCNIIIKKNYYSTIILANLQCGEIQTGTVSNKAKWQPLCDLEGVGGGCGGDVHSMMSYLVFELPTLHC